MSTDTSAITISDRAIGSAAQRMRSFLQEGPITFVFRSQSFPAPEITPDLSVAEVNSDGGRLLICLPGYYNSPVWLKEGTTLRFLSDRCVARGTDLDDLRVMQFIRGRKPSEIEQELRDLLPITWEEAQTLQELITADLDPHIEVDVVLGPLSTGWMNRRFEQQGRKYSVLLTLHTPQQTLEVFPLVHSDQWRKIQEVSAHRSPSHVQLTGSLTDEEVALGLQYSQMLQALRGSRGVGMLNNRWGK